MNLQISCVEAEEAPPPPPAKVDVFIGNSRSNTKCVNAPGPVTCDVDAGNFGKRLNDHPARDTWEITTNGAQVCARRTDRNQGWGMQLKIGCVEAEEEAAEKASEAAAFFTGDWTGRRNDFTGDVGINF